MVYCIHSKIQVTGKLEVVRSLHVGGFGTSTNVDLPLAVNGQGQVYIPGTSLAGALRSWMSQLCDVESVKALWGFQPELGRTNSKQEGHASRLTIEDAIAYLPPKNTNESPRPMTLRDMEIRSGVGIDRHRGAAAENCLYNRGVIPRGTKLTFQLSVEITSLEKEADIKQAIDQLLLAMHAEEIRLGAAKSRGLGRVKLVDCKQPVMMENADGATKGVQPFRVGDRAGMLSFLQYRSDPNANLKTWQKPETTLTLPRLTLKLKWQPIGPLMVKSELTGAVVDILPLMGGVDTDSAFLLPGSSIKGALRSQAERIVRTVLHSPLDSETDFKQQIRLPLVNTLFGLAADDKKPIPKGALWSGGLGALFIEDCFSSTRYAADTLQQLSRVPEEATSPHQAVQELQSVLASTKLTDASNKASVDTQLAYHVAIDRWTGGAADSFLYTNLEPFNLPWESIELAIDFKRFPNEADEQLAGVALLLLLLRDLGNRRIPLGYGVNRGLGTMSVNEVEFSVHGAVPEPLSALNQKFWQAQSAQPLSFDTLDEPVLNALNSAWSSWIQQNTNQ